MPKQKNGLPVNRWVLSLSLCASTLLGVEGLHAQNAAAYEYMTASSPLKNGWTVTSQTMPGRSISTVVTPGPVSVSGNGVTLVPTSMQTAVSPTLASPAVPPSGSWVWVPTNGSAISPSGVPVITQPTLGITSNNTLKPTVASANANCQCQPTQYATAYALNSTGVSPYSTGVPTVPFAPPAPLPGTVPTSYTVNPTTTGAPAPGTVAPVGSTTTTAYYPYLTGNFQPLVATQNMPPGTYLGRGLIGQPTAYVDGQPVRNLFRYIFP